MHATSRDPGRIPTDHAVLRIHNDYRKLGVSRRAVATVLRDWSTVRPVAASGRAPGDLRGASARCPGIRPRIRCADATTQRHPQAPRRGAGRQRRHRDPRAHRRRPPRSLTDQHRYGRLAAPEQPQGPSDQLVAPRRSARGVRDSEAMSVAPADSRSPARWRDADAPTGVGRDRGEPVAERRRRWGDCVSASLFMPGGVSGRRRGSGARRRSAATPARRVAVAELS